MPLSKRDPKAVLQNALDAYYLASKIVKCQEIIATKKVQREAASETSASSVQQISIDELIESSQKTFKDAEYEEAKQFLERINLLKTQTKLTTAQAIDQRTVLIFTSLQRLHNHKHRVLHKFSNAAGDLDYKSLAEYYQAKLLTGPKSLLAYIKSRPTPNEQKIETLARLSIIEQKEQLLDQTQSHSNGVIAQGDNETNLSVDNGALKTGIIEALIAAVFPAKSADHVTPPQELDETIFSTILAGKNTSANIVHLTVERLLERNPAFVEKFLPSILDTLLYNIDQPIQSIQILQSYLKQDHQGIFNLLFGQKMLSTHATEENKEAQLIDQLKARIVRAILRSAGTSYNAVRGGVNLIHDIIIRGNEDDWKTILKYSQRHHANSKTRTPEDTTATEPTSSERKQQVSKDEFSLHYQKTAICRLTHYLINDAINQVVLDNQSSVSFREILEVWHDATEGTVPTLYLNGLKKLVKKMHRKDLEMQDDKRAKSLAAFTEVAMQAFKHYIDIYKQQHDLKTKDQLITHITEHETSFKRHCIEHINSSVQHEYEQLNTAPASNLNERNNDLIALIQYYQTQAEKLKATSNFKDDNNIEVSLEQFNSSGDTFYTFVLKLYNWAKDIEAWLNQNKTDADIKKQLQQRQQNDELSNLSEEHIDVLIKKTKTSEYAKKLRNKVIKQVERQESNQGIDTQDAAGNTPLMLIMQHQNVNYVIEKFIARQPNMMLCTYEDANNALHIGVLHNNHEALQKLIHSNIEGSALSAALAQCNQNGATPIELLWDNMQAETPTSSDYQKRERLNTASAFVKKGAALHNNGPQWFDTYLNDFSLSISDLDPSTKNNNGDNLLHFLLKETRLEEINRLLTQDKIHREDIEAVNHDGKSCIDVLVERALGDTEQSDEYLHIIEKLLSKKPQLLTQNGIRDYDSALHKAIRHQNVRIVTQLCSAAAAAEDTEPFQIRSNVPDEHFTPLAFAFILEEGTEEINAEMPSRRTKIIHKLFAAGAKLSNEDLLSSTFHTVFNHIFANKAESDMVKLITTICQSTEGCKQLKTPMTMTLDTDIEGLGKAHEFIALTPLQYLAYAQSYRLFSRALHKYIDHCEDALTQDNLQDIFNTCIATQVELPKKIVLLAQSRLELHHTSISNQASPIERLIKKQYLSTECGEEGDTSIPELLAAAAKTTGDAFFTTVNTNHETCIVHIIRVLLSGAYNEIHGDYLSSLIDYLQESLSNETLPKDALTALLQRPYLPSQSLQLSGEAIGKPTKLADILIEQKTYPEATAKLLQLASRCGIATSNKAQAEQGLFNALKSRNSELVVANTAMALQHHQRLEFRDAERRFPLAIALENNDEKAFMVLLPHSNLKQRYPRKYRDQYHAIDTTIPQAIVTRTPYNDRFLELIYNQDTASGIIKQIINCADLNGALTNLIQTGKTREKLVRAILTGIKAQSVISANSDQQHFTKHLSNQPDTLLLALQRQLVPESEIPWCVEQVLRSTTKLDEQLRRIEQLSEIDKLSKTQNSTLLFIVETVATLGENKQAMLQKCADLGAQIKSVLPDAHQQWYHSLSNPVLAEMFCHESSRHLQFNSEVLTSINQLNTQDGLSSEVLGNLFRQIGFTLYNPSSDTEEDAAFFTDIHESILLMQQINGGDCADATRQRLVELRDKYRLHPQKPAGYFSPQGNAALERIVPAKSSPSDNHSKFTAAMDQVGTLFSYKRHSPTESASSGSSHSSDDSPTNGQCDDASTGRFGRVGAIFSRTAQKVKGAAQRRASTLGQSTE